MNRLFNFDSKEVAENFISKNNIKQGSKDRALGSTYIELKKGRFYVGDYVITKSDFATRHQVCLKYSVNKIKTL
jgi:hypothetical protein